MKTPLVFDDLEVGMVFLCSQHGNNHCYEIIGKIVREDSKEDCIVWMSTEHKFSFVSSRLSLNISSAIFTLMTDPMEVI